MSEIDEEKKKIRGFASLINSILIPLNENEKFQEKFKKIKVKILLNATNFNYAALIFIDYGFVKVESIPNKPKLNLKKRKVGWDAFLEMDIATFLTIAMNRMSLLGVAKMWLTRKIKMRGIRKLLLLLKVFKLLVASNN